MVILYIKEDKLYINSKYFFFSVGSNEKYYLKKIMFLRAHKKCHCGNGKGYYSFET
jgi:hypothetical protein